MQTTIVLLAANIYTCLSMASITTFSTLLYIPGTYYSLANLTYDVTGLDQYYNI